jgi:hypothetical protein
MIRRITLLLITVILLANCKTKETPPKEAFAIPIHNLPRIKDNIGALNDLFIPYGDDISDLKILLGTSELFLIQFIYHPDGAEEKTMIHQLLETDYPKCINLINTRRKMFAGDSETKMAEVLTLCDTLIEKEKRIITFFETTDLRKNESSVARIKASVQTKGEINQCVKKIELELYKIAFFISLQKIACLREMRADLK